MPTPQKPAYELNVKVDPRPTSYDSVAEARFQEEDEGDLIDDAIECAEWDVIRPERADLEPRLAFVDGVERRECRVSIEGNGLPVHGMLASYAAGAAVPDATPPVAHVSVQRRAIMTGGASLGPIEVRATNTALSYLPEHNSETTTDSIFLTLSQLRANLEASIVQQLIDADCKLIIVDGRLPPIVHASVVGLIKTPHRIPLSKQTHIDTLLRLRKGERTPVFTRRRSARAYYSWFVCLQDLGPLDICLSNLALIEMDDSARLTQAIGTANVTTAHLPDYAPTAFRDPRSPQNLLPVGQLERHLRHHLGDPVLIDRLTRRSIKESRPPCSL